MMGIKMEQSKLSSYSFILREVSYLTSSMMRVDETKLLSAMLLPQSVSILSRNILEP